MYINTYLHTRSRDGLHVVVQIEIKYLCDLENRHARLMVVYMVVAMENSFQAGSLGVLNRSTC